MNNRIDKLVLGTVQFGLNYGINNFNGKPTREKSLAMLEYAWQNGVRTFDTAYAYGDAEEILGEFTKAYNLGAEIKIITKLKPNILSDRKGSVLEIIKKNLEESLERLNRDYVNGYLLHTPSYIHEPKVIAALKKLKKHGLVKNIGVSIYEVDDAIYAAGLAEVDYIQIPYSILDQRLDNKVFWNLTKKNKITVFARSAFLQGLFFMPQEKIPKHLEKVKLYLNKLDKIIGKYHLTRQQATLLFSCCNKNINCVVFGVDIIDQLIEDLQIVKDSPDCGKCIHELKNEFRDIEKSVIFPSLWKK
jgi:aryl-alcohol dehydrogenase-like predicted oxidoreductase